MPPKSALTITTLRAPNQPETAFRIRVERAARLTQVLVDGALANHCVRAFIDDPALPYSIESVRLSPDVRVEFAEAIAIGDLFGSLRATRSKHWGDGPVIRPLQPDDPVDPVRLLYIYRPSSRLRRRYEQRVRLKDLLGRRYRQLVGRAYRQTRRSFLASLSIDEAQAIRRILRIGPIQFWRAAKGHRLIDLPPRLVQLEFNFSD
jgi:hypothetical protein